MRRITDDTGIFQHTKFGVPDRSKGYTTDDNARALIAAVLLYSSKKDPVTLALIHTYISFIHHAQNTDGNFRNFMDYNRTFVEDSGSEDCQGRTVVLSGQFGWNDIGSWDALGAIFPPDKSGNIIKANHMGLDTRNSIIYGNGRLITTIGVDGFIIADTGDALLICPKDKAQSVKDIVELLKENGMTEYI
ncbi:hypothetical protein [Paenibacillus alkaliterrae]